MLTIIILIIFVSLMIWAAYSDLTNYRLSNKLCLATAGLYIVYIIARYVDGNALAISDITGSIIIAFILFVICAGLFALNVMGGGDVKFIPAVALWAGKAYFLQYLLIMSLVGGLIAAFIIANNRIKASKYYKSSENINLSVAEKEGSAVPYGVGIAVGGLFVAYQLFVTITQIPS